MICLNPELLSKLSSKGILAYVAVTTAGNGIATTAGLAAVVRTQSAAMLEGLKELELHSPDTVTRRDKKWQCGKGGGQVQLLESSERFRELVDDLKKYWDFLNPEIPFSFSGTDGTAVRLFLRDHPQWTQEMWQRALNHRGRSVKHFGNGSRTQEFAHWVRRLGDYAAGPLNEYGRPVEGSGNVGKAIAVEHANSAAAAAYLTGRA